jgi:serine/threonine protein kinase
MEPADFPPLESGDGSFAAPALEVAAKAMAEDAAPSLIGRQLGSYRVLSLLGTGGMGEVYRARDTKLGRDVAIKILPSAFTTDPDRLARFRREARAVAALNHPNIVTIFSIEEHDAVPFMTMELIEGRTLDQGIPGGGLSLARFFDIAIALADAFSAAHRKAIIHRDLKPANVMVTNDGHVKVLDFGGRRPRPRRGRRHLPRAHADRDHRRHDAVHVARTDRRQAAGSSY